MGVRYATREQVKSALDIMTTARRDSDVDSALDAATDSVYGSTLREFRPKRASKSYDWPNQQRAPSWTLWLDTQPDQLISLSSITTGGVALGVGEYYLEPNELGPPYVSVNINLGGNASFVSGSTTWQRSIVMDGLWGFRADFTTAGLIAEALDASETGLDVTAAASAAIGVGDMLRVDSEYLNVVGRQSADTGQNTTGSLAADVAGDAVGVADGTGYAVGEVISVDTERMLVLDILGNTLAVRRAYDGTRLAAHSGSADVFAQRTLIVERGFQGTTATTHVDASTVSRHVVPGLVEAVAIGEAVNTLLQRRAGYGRVVGSGDNQYEATGRSLATLRKDLVQSLGRMSRKGAI
jgi:hypothetical protein